MADPDLQIRGGGGHPDPEIREGGQFSKNVFWPFGPQFSPKIGGGAGPLDTPLRSMSLVHRRKTHA